MFSDNECCVCGRDLHHTRICGHCGANNDDPKDCQEVEREMGAAMHEQALDNARQSFARETGYEARF